MNFNYNPDGTARFTFKNGIIDIPAEGGMHIISPGTGCGKTETIKQLILDRFNDGILYCVDTIVSLRAVYTFTRDELVVKRKSLGDDDIAIISSDDHSKWNEYAKDPDALMNKKIIFITHVRFWTDISSKFLLFNPTSPDDFKGDFKTLLHRKDLRRWIIFDETPMFIRPFWKMKRCLLGLFSTKGEAGWLCKTRTELDQSYAEFLKDTDEDFFKHKTSVLALDKREIVFSRFPDYYPSWMTCEKDSYVNMTFSPRLLKEPCDSHILIFEGAGDVLFQGEHLLSIPGKYYNSNLLMTQFNFVQKRKTYDKITYSLTLKELEAILNRHIHEDVLIVVWKDFGNMNDSCDCYDEETYDEETASAKSVYVKKIEKALKNKGFKNFMVTYYGAADTKSVNDYKDFNTIVLCGKWLLPYTVATQFNINWGTKTSPESYNLWYYVQLISRIGIRKHEGGTFHIYYSSDFPVDHIKAIYDYFSRQTFTCKEWYYNWRDVLERRKIKKAIKMKIEKVIAVHKDLAELIERQTSGNNFSISAKELNALTYNWSYADRSKLQKRLAPSFSKLGIILNITL